MITRRTIALGLLWSPLPALAGPQDIRQGLFDAVNGARRGRNRAALSYNPQLAQAAQSLAETMLRTGDFSHSAGGTSMAGRVKRTGYRYRRLSENIAWLSRRNATDAALAQAIHGMWMTSSGHLANILDPRVTDIGIGIAQKGSRTYAAQVFGQPA